MNTPQVVQALAALAHEHRLTAYRALVEAGPEGMSAGVIAERLKLPPSSLTFHVQNLERAGLIFSKRMSRHIIYSADFTVMNALVAFLTENCCGGDNALCASECEPARPAKAVRRASKIA